MLDDQIVKRIRRLRAVEGATYQEIEARTGVPKTSAHYAVMGRRKSSRELQRQWRVRKNKQTIITLRAHIRRLEAELESLRRAERATA